MKHSIIIALIISLSLIYNITAGDIDNDIAAISTATYTYSGVFQVICLLSHDKTNDIYRFSDAKFASKTDAISFYQAIVTNYASLNHANVVPPSTSTTTYGSGFATSYLTASEALCVLRSDDPSSTAPSVPSLSTLQTTTDPYYSYLFFPTIYGYHPNGGAIIYHHLDQLTFSSVNYFVFTADFDNYYSNQNTKYNALPSGFTDIYTLWGPYYRYNPTPEFMLWGNTTPSYLLDKTYYIFPRIKDKDGKSIKFTGTVSMPSSALSDANKANIQGFISGSDSSINYNNNACSFSSSTDIWISRLANNCSWNAGTTSVDCTVIDTATTATSFKTITGPLTFVGFCRDSNNGSRWMIATPATLS